MKLVRVNSLRSAPVRLSGPRARCTQSVRSQAGAPVLVTSDGKRYTVEKTALVGSAPSADIPAAGPGIVPEHARLEFKSGRLFCTALHAADPDSLLSPTATWLAGSELRHAVAYMVAPGATLSFGTEGANALTAEFEEASGAGGMAEMLMKGMAQGAPAEVQERLKDL